MKSFYILALAMLLPHCAEDKKRQKVIYEEPVDLEYTLDVPDFQLSEDEMQLPDAVTTLELELVAKEMASMFVLDNIDPDSIDMGNPMMQQTIVADQNSLVLSASLNLTEHKQQNSPPQDLEKFEVSYVYYVGLMHFKVSCEGGDLQRYNGMLLGQFLTEVKVLPSECEGLPTKFFSYGKKEVRLKYKAKNGDGIAYATEMLRDTFSSDEGKGCWYQPTSLGWSHDGCMQILDYEQVIQDKLTAKRFMASIADHVELSGDDSQYFYQSGAHQVWINGWQGIAEHDPSGYNWYITNNSQEEYGRTSFQTEKAKKTLPSLF